MGKPAMPVWPAFPGEQFKNQIVTATPIPPMNQGVKVYAHRFEHGAQVQWSVVIRNDSEGHVIELECHNENTASAIVAAILLGAPGARRLETELTTIEQKEAL